MSKTTSRALCQSDRDAFAALGLDKDPDSYTVQDVDSHWRTLRSQLHPDRPGGDATRFDLASKAYKAARFYALEPKPCLTCGGAGKVEKSSAMSNPLLKPMEINCGTCKGSGRQ